MKNSKGLIYTFLRTHRHITLSAPGNDGGPEGITVNYFVDRDQLYVYINLEDYIKYPGHLAAAEVAGVVSADHKTLQMVAQCRQLNNRHSNEIRIKIESNDPNAKYFFTTSTKFFHIVPSIMRYQDYSKRPIENAFYETDLAIDALQNL